MLSYKIYQLILRHLVLALILRMLVLKDAKQTNDVELENNAKIANNKINVCIYNVVDTKSAIILTYNKPQHNTRLLKQ